ncbi:MAG: hypothetical protein EB828_04515 [Nitrosopumilus sp. D6]|nr:MAG: hypothetical protein EB828_04515 [Nitrosopumilus sp. D6]
MIKIHNNCKQRVVLCYNVLAGYDKATEPNALIKANSDESQGSGMSDTVTKGLQGVADIVTGTVGSLVDKPEVTTGVVRCE